ncbi:integrase/recombinase XerC [Pseudoduganella flava]|uniref:Tyrosine recombinase XerC n=1 Tax=Pseudoduganella flava TaxID=871742 RepID=A0A562PQ19_9BURK|nr:tyrosine recombinase XerC [Pseudoduganella flava]QGZ40700.1 tyrosine-type recombinase/integrase [Pseudoduganella flava]TWI46156.1 integrase/recombinase XerC [Pseudoduganella flava]
MNAARGKAEWSADWLRHLATQRKLSPRSVAAYGRDIAELATLSGELPWPAITPADIRRYTAKLHAGGLQARSIARKLSGWRGFFGWLAEHTALAANPVDGVRAPKRAKGLPKALSVEHAVQLVATPARTAATPTPAELCNTAMFELLYSSGLRVSELCGLDVHFVKADGVASAGWLERDNGEVVVTGKGNKMRRVPVGKAALAAIDTWLTVRPAPRDGSTALFLTERATRMSPRVVQMRLKAHALATGTPVHVHPHMMRHSFASHVLQSSGDLRAVQEMLGHASITSTQVYTALDFQHLAEVYDKAHPRARSGSNKG